MNAIPASATPLHRDRSVFAILLALYVVVLHPILRADRYYQDDLKRALFGHTGWDSNGRPLTTLLMKLLQCYDHALVDISPLPQIGAIAVLAWIGVLIARRYDIRAPWLAALVALPLGAQPFFLENLSYKFDALSMSLAVLLALLPILVPRYDRRGWWLGVLALFASLNFYQPAINVFAIFVLLNVVIGQIGDRPPRELARDFLMGVLQVFTAMLVYELVVGIHVNGWVKRKSEVIHSPGDLPRIGDNLAGFLHYIAGSFNVQWWRYFGPAVAGLGLVVVLAGIGYARRMRATQSPTAGAALLVVSLALPFAAIASMFGPMLLLVDPLRVPRVLVGVGALLAAGLIAMQAAFRRWSCADAWAIAAASMFAIGMASFASAYGNALGEQRRYEERIAARLADDLGDLRARRSIRAVLLDGPAGFAPVVAHVAGELPLVQAMVPTYIDGADMFHTHIFLAYFIRDFDDLRLAADPAARERNAALLAKSCRLVPLLGAGEYRLWVIEDVAVVRFGAGDPERCGDAAAPAAQ